MLTWVASAILFFFETLEDGIGWLTILGGLGLVLGIAEAVGFYCYPVLAVSRSSIIYRSNILARPTTFEREGVSSWAQTGNALVFNVAGGKSIRIALAELHPPDAKRLMQALHEFGFECVGPTFEGA